MITLAILQQMAHDITDLETDQNFFWEELPLYHDGTPAEGVWIVTRGGSAINTPNGHNLKCTIDFYVADKNKVHAEAYLAEIADWIRQHRVICDLSGNAGDSSYAFENVRITSTTTPMNNGATTNGNIVKIASANVVYDRGTIINS